MPLRQQPIAVIGFAFRFPRGLECLDSLRAALLSRFSAIDTVPPARWAVERYYSSNPVSKGKAYIRRGGFLQQDISQFDANFFGISPRDAENMDPQQRLLLEVVWESFENAGLSLPAHAGRNVGVYVGGFMLDHMISQMAPSNRSQINQHTAAGMMMTMLSNRISHTFDLRGPSLSIDTACSSSLVAFHYACQDIWHNAAELAIVGGANVMTRPEYPMGMCKGHFLARDGECKSFDARGDGYGRGEGAAAILLKPLDRALRDGDPILATVIGSGTNQDGRTPGISMPSRSAQQSLIEQVCRDYEINPRDVQYVECHGTGTAVGDPTETAAIGAVYGQARTGVGPVVIGSIKSNIGHTEAVAGVAGVIKAVVTTMDRQAYPLGNLQTPHPDIPCDEWNLQISDQLIPLDDKFCAAINSFGYGGSNAHIVLQTWPNALQASDNGHSNVRTNAAGDSAGELGIAKQLPYFLPISARSQAALAALAGRYAEFLEQRRATADLALEDVLFTASHKRAHLSHRAVIEGHTAHELINGLKALACGQDSPDVVTGTVPYSGNTTPVFVFTGMGPQWWAMGQELYQRQPTYRTAVEEADAIFQAVAGFSILAEMLKCESESQISITEFAQPANLIIQIGLLAVLKAAGVQPGAVVGHSVGELASAYAAGVLTLEDCMTVSYHRSRLQATCRGTGGMWAAAISPSRAQSLIEGMRDSVSIAAINGPSNVTLAGDPDRLADIAEQLSREGIFNRKLEVEVPYHSPMMEPIIEPLRQALACLTPREPTLPLYSTVTGKLVHGDTRSTQAYDAEYWTRNVRQPVEFASAIFELLEAGYTNFIEVGPHPVLATSLNDCIRQAGKECRTLQTLRRNTPEINAVHRAIMQVHASGSPLDWKVLNGRGRMVALPNYAWQREKYWLENDRAAQDRIASVEYPILGIQEAPGAPQYRNDFDHEPMLYLRDHVVTGMPVLPAAAYVEALLELAVIHYPDAAAWSLRELTIQSPLLLNPERGTDFVTDFDPLTQHAVIRSLENGRLGFGQNHVHCRVGQAHGLVDEEPLPLDQWMRQLPEQSSIAELYNALAGIGLTYGPAFQTVRELRVDPSAGRLLARIELNRDLAGDLHKYRLHPTLLDACFHSLMTMLVGADSTYLPTGLQELALYARHSPDTLYCYAQRVHQDARHIDCNLTLVDRSGQLVATIRGMRLTAASKRERTDKHGDRVREQILAYDWFYAESSGEPKRLGHWLVVGGHGPLAEQVAERLEHYGTVVAACLSIGNEFRQDGNRYTLRQANSEDINRVLAECGELDGVVLVHGLDSAPSGGHYKPPEHLSPQVQQSSQAMQCDPTGEQSIAHLLTFTQALHGRAASTIPRVYVVTRCGLAVKDYDPQIVPSQAAINGFTRVAFNELDGFRFTSIDLPARITDETVDSLTVELLSDAEHDEVAFRGSLRYVSELTESRMLSQDIVQQQRLDDNHPVQIRALRSDSQSPGTGRLIAMPNVAPGPDQIQLRIESMVIPPDLLLDPTADGIDQALVEVVGRIVATGGSATQGAFDKSLDLGQRVAGFAPADLCSHMTGMCNQFHLVPISDSLPAEKVVAQLGNLVRAQLAVESALPQAGETALVELDEFGVVLADQLSAVGVKVYGVHSAAHAALASRSVYPMVHCNSHDMQWAVDEYTQGRGFTIIASQLASWIEHNGLWMLADGGTLIDLAGQSSRHATAPHVGLLVRTDLRAYCQRPQRMQRALQRATELLVQSDHANCRALDVSIADIAWRKLPLAGNVATLTLSFDSGSVELPVVQPTQMQVNAAGTYLVTGGLGGFGQKTALWLVDHGARSLVLTSRHGIDSPQRQQFVDSLRARGVNVLVAACDGSQFDQVADLFAQIDRQMPPLVGIYHSAAVIIDQLILEMDLPTLSQVMRNKALAAWHLHQLTKDRALEQFVMYSSVANLVGNARQAAYSAANGFLNGLAYMRRSMGLAATSVNWGVIGDVGVVAQDEKLEQYLRYTGMRGIQSRDALNVLGQALARDVTQFGLTLISSWADWARFETRGSKSPRFATLIASDTQGNNSSVRDAILAELIALTSDEQVEVLSGLILEVIAGVLKADPASIAIDRKIEQLGVDSLMATEIQALLGSQLGLSVSVLELIGDATIRSLTVQSLKSLLSGGSSMAAQPVDSLQPMSESRRDSAPTV